MDELEKLLTNDVKDLQVLEEITTLLATQDTILKQIDEDASLIEAMTSPEAKPTAAKFQKYLDQLFR